MNILVVFQEPGNFKILLCSSGHVSTFDTVNDLSNAVGIVNSLVLSYGWSVEWATGRSKIEPNSFSGGGSAVAGVVGSE